MIDIWLYRALILSVLILIVIVSVFVLFGFHVRASYPIVEVNGIKDGVIKYSPETELFPFESKSSEFELDEIEARSFMAFNPTTHQIYVSDNLDVKLPIASLTKLMTAQIALDTWELDKTLVSGENDIEWLEWVVGLEKDDKISLDDALRAMLISSFNDAAVVVAENYPGGYEGFIEEMNRRGEILGMDDTKFTNPAGLHDPDHYSTASDLSKLVKYVLADGRILHYSNIYTDQIEIERGEEIILIDLLSTNQLIGSDPFLKGLKTGFTKESGPSFIGYYDAGGSEKLVTIILDAEHDRFQATKELVELLRMSYE